MATRRERVVLELEDNFTTGMARAAASAALLNRELDSLSKDSVRTRRSVSDIDQPIKNLGQSAGRSGNEIDKMSGRMRILADVTAILGPGLVGIGAVGVPAITGLAAQMGFAVTAAGTAVLAFQGVGDTLKALNAASLNPTTENLQKAQVALENLSPAAQGFVAQLGSMLPELHKLRDVAAEGLFPGLTVGLDALESALPHVQGLLAGVSNELGNIAGDAGASLASDRWTPFLDFLARDAPAALGQMADAAGNAGHAVAELWMATSPINNDFSQWLVNATDDLDKWATGLGKTQGFADFMDYLDKTGPKVAEAFGAIANAALQIVQAAAPLSGPVLDGVTALANLISSIANSDIGTPLFTAVAALSLFNRTMALADGLQKASFGGPAAARVRGMGAGIAGLTADLRSYNAVQNTAAGRARATAKQIDGQAAAAGRLGERAKTFGRTAGLIAGVGIAASGAADGIGLTNTASLALMGTIGGPWGAALGAGAGAVLDLKAAVGSYSDTLKQADQALKTNSRSQHEAALDALQQQAAYLATSNSFKANVTRIFAFAKAHTSGTGVGGAGDDIIAKATEIKQALRMDDARAEQGLLQDGFHATAAGIDTATQSTQDFINKLQDLNDVLAGRASFRGFEQAIDDFAERAKKRAKVLKEIAAEQASTSLADTGINRDLSVARGDLAGAKTPAQRQSAQGRIADLKDRRTKEHAASLARIADLQAEAKALENSINPDLQKGRDTLDLLDNIANKALAFATTIKDPVKQTEFLAGARAEYEKTAIKAGYAKDAAKALADQVLGLSGVKGEPKIVIDANGVPRVIDAIAARLERLTRKTYKINIKAQAANVQAAIMDIHSGKAGGGTIRGQRYPYADKVLVPLAPGEEVITNRNGEADKWRPFLKRINAGLANGGTVPFPTSAAMTGPAIDYDRLTQAVIAARPMFGDVHLSGDGAFEREQRARTAALGGVGRPTR